MNTNRTFKKIGFALLLAAVLPACKKDNNEPGDEDLVPTEHKYVRVLVADQTTAKLTLIEPSAAKMSTFDAKFPLASLYPTASGRYAAVLHGANNLAEVFDSGLDSHGDHIDIAGQPKWSPIIADGLKPTHFKSRGTESLIFNDGDGTLSAANESDFNKPGAKFRTINAGLPAHHGAMAQFSNGTYAVTVAASSGGTPTQVKIIDKNGATIQDAAMQVGGLHGNASDGQVAVFGAYTSTANTAGGALVVDQSGQQRMIPNPDGFGAARLGTIYYAENARKFIGYSAAKGAYLIDVSANKMTPIYSGTDAFQCKVDYAGKNLLILSSDGKLRIYDLSSGMLKKEGSVIPAINQSDTYKPVLEATERYAYIAVPNAGEVHQVDLTDLSKVTKHKVPGNPVRLIVFGFETSKGHD